MSSRQDGQLRRRLHVLVVDDDVLALERIANRLTDHGVRVSTSDIAENLESRIASLEPDLVLLDVLMPNLSGSDVVQLLRSRAADEPPKIALLSPVPPALLTALIDTTFALKIVHATNSDRFLDELVALTDSVIESPPISGQASRPAPFISGTHRIDLPAESSSLPVVTKGGQVA